MKKTIIWVGILVFAISFAVYGAEKEEVSEEKSIAVSMWNTTGPSAVLCLDLVERASKISGVKIVAMADDYNADNQIRNTENFAAMGVDGVMHCNASDEVMAKVADVAAKEKFLFGQYFRTISKPDIKKYVFSSPHCIGNTHENEENTGYIIGMKLGDLGYRNVAITTGPHGDFTAETRYKGLVRGLEEAGVNVVAEQWEVTNGETAVKAAENFINIYPELEVVCVMYSVEAITGARNAIINAGKQGEIKIAAMDFTGVPEVDMDMFKKGDAAVLAGGHLIDPLFTYVMLANAVMGTPLSDKPEEVILSHIILTNYEEAEIYFTEMEKGGHLMAYTDEELRNMFKKFNPSFTIDELKKMAKDWSIDDFKRRHGFM
jgi:ABC-type sugar transport system substrate-binding protein